MRGQQMLGVLVVVGAVCGFGCHFQASARGEAESPVTYASTPTLVAAGSGVWVVRGSARAVYYTNDSYWCYREGTWYRSASWEGGWVVVQASVVPSVVVTRDHSKYVNYTGEANAETRVAPKGDLVASADSPSKHPHGGPPGHDDTPGLGNQKKAAGLQPGEVGASANKSDPPKAEPAKAKAEPAKAKEEPPKAKSDPPKADDKPKDDGPKPGKKK
jgi:hypothetical protein